LRPGLKTILEEALGRPRPRTDFLRRDFPESGQREIALSFARSFGYDLGRGRLDTTVHPFEISFTREDVRITTRYRRNYLPPALFGAMHEAGHGLYEQNVDPAYTRTALATDLVGLYAVGGTSFGAHESQSRLWENHVGRSRGFWRLNFPALRETFPEALSDVDAEAFHAAVNAPAPSLIRTEADELTYDFHIMLRVDLEAALIAGALAVSDIPAAWNARIKEELGLDVPNDREGCLQDIHWSSGMIGSFCTYTIGNVMAAQLFEAARSSDESLQDALDAGDYAPLRSWLSHHVCRHGRRFTRQELLEKATGRPLTPEPYLAYLSRKHGTPLPR
jgi:carboxypeptidase Taq